MQALGFERFSVAGHDRGGRVACRLALDHPERLERLATLDILPTGEQVRGGPIDSGHFMAEEAPAATAAALRDFFGQR